MKDEEREAPDQEEVREEARGARDRAWKSWEDAKSGHSSSPSSPPSVLWAYRELGLKGGETEQEAKAAYRARAKEA